MLCNVCYLNPGVLNTGCSRIKELSTYIIELVIIKLDSELVALTVVTGEPGNVTAQASVSHPAYSKLQVVGSPVLQA